MRTTMLLGPLVSPHGSIHPALKASAKLLATGGSGRAGHGTVGWGAFVARQKKLSTLLASPRAPLRIKVVAKAARRSARRGASGS